LLPALPPALLALANGTHFIGHAVGAPGHAIGEVVFNTAMTGYQEILTDPSYCRQIVTLTYPHIGNYGVNPEDVEAGRVHAAGLVIRDLPLLASNFRSTRGLGDYLRAEGLVAIAGIDTRRLTRMLRTQGTQSACIVAFEAGAEVGAAQIAQAVERARSAPSMTGLDLAQEVSVDAAYTWTQTEWVLGRGYGDLSAPRWHVVAYDFGVKRNILRLLASRGCRVTVVPARTTAAEALALRPDGIFLSNGPGDPQPCDYAIAATRELCRARLPVFGICLGHQILALASGANLQDEVRPPRREPSGEGSGQGRVSITSQNHGFAVDAGTLPANLRPTHVSLFDGTLQGLAAHRPAGLCFQGHPEASPGPHDIDYLFDRFVALIEEHHAQAHRPEIHPHHRRRADRHRPGLRVRLFGRAGLQGAARGGLPRRLGQQQSGDDHDRPGDGRRHLHRADHLAGAGANHRQGASGLPRRKDGAAADDGRPDRAELRARPAQQRRAGEGTASR
jgi:carbamoyl-phosphate synthase small subunit